MSADQLNLDQQRALANLAYTLGHNPKTRAGFARLVSEVDPGRARAAFGDVLQEHRFNQLEQKIEEKLDLSGARAQREKFDRQREKLKERYDDKQIGEIEKVMQRVGLADWDAGATLYAAENPQPDPSLMPPDDAPETKWGFPTVPGRDGKELSFKEFAADPRTHSMNAAYKIIGEFKRAKMPSSFAR